MLFDDEAEFGACDEALWLVSMRAGSMVDRLTLVDVEVIVVAVGVGGVVASPVEPTPPLDGTACEIIEADETWRPPTTTDDDAVACVSAAPVVEASLNRATVFVTATTLASTESTRLASWLISFLRSIFSSLSNEIIWFICSPLAAVDAAAPGLVAPPLGVGECSFSGGRLPATPSPLGGGVSLVSVPPGVVGSSLMAGCRPKSAAKPGFVGA